MPAYRDRKFIFIFLIRPFTTLIICELVRMEWSVGMRAPREVVNGIRVTWHSLNGWRLTVSSTHSLVVQLNFVYIARNRQSRRIAPQMIPLHYIPFMAFRIYRI